MHRLYLQALQIWNNGIVGSYAAAEDMIGEALKLDPDYVPAWTLLALIYYVQRNRDLRPVGEDTWALIRTTVDKAEAIEQEHPFVLSWRSFIARDRDRDFQAAIDYSRRALTKSPSDETLLRNFANFARNIGRVEASLPIYEMLLARSPLCLRCYEHAFVAYNSSGQYEQTLAEGAHVRSLALDSNRLRKEIALAHVLLGEPEAALEELSGIDDIYPGDVMKSHGRALAYFSLGRVAEAQREFEATIDGANECQEAQVSAWMGDIDDAFERLTGFNASRCGLDTDPLLRGMHDDPRWPALLEANRIPGVEELDFSLDFITSSIE